MAELNPGVFHRGLGLLLIVASLLGVASCAEAQPGKVRDRDLGPSKKTQEKPAETRLFDKVHAVCVGINDYESGDIPGLTFAVADAEELGATFKNRFGYEVTTLTKKQATRAAIVAAMENLNKTAGPNDVIVFFFAGHGGTVAPADSKRKHEKSGFIIPYDGRVHAGASGEIEPVESSAINMRELTRKLKDCKAKHVLLLLDCCFSGFAGDVTERSLPPGAKAEVNQLLIEPTRQVLTAGTETQKVFEVDSDQHGVFTAAILKHLQSSDILSVNKLFGNVRGEVIAKAAEYDRKMTPQLRQIKPSNGDWVFINQNVQDYDSLVKTTEQREEAVSQDDYTKLVADTTPAAKPDQPSAPAARSLEKDPEYQRKFKHYEERASYGDPWAMAALQYCYAHGIGTPAQPDRAFQWAAEANDYNRDAGSVTLAECYSKGIGVPIDQQIAAQFNQQISTQLQGALNNLLPKSVSAPSGGKGNPEWIDKASEILGDLFKSDDYRTAITQSGKIQAAVSKNDWKKSKSLVDDWRAAVTRLKSQAAATSDPQQFGTICDELLSKIAAVEEKRKLNLPTSTTTALAATHELVEKLKGLTPRTDPPKP